MKFRTRIILSFVIIMIVPFLLAGMLYASTRMYHEVSGNEAEETLYEAIINANAPDDVREVAVDFTVSTVLILVLTGIILLTWIYYGIVPRMEGLIDAARRIQEGELDFTIPRGGKDEISELAGALEDMRMHLEANAREKLEAEQEQRQLISNIAHDLKTPITAVKGYAEGLLDGVASTPEKQRAYLTTIQSKAAEMDSLINELFLYSQINANRIPYRFRHLPAAAYFGRQADALSMDLAQQNIRLGYAADIDGETEIIADPDQLNRVILNIVGNSVKYMDKEEREIRMTVRDAADFVQVEIADNGKGIAPQDLPHIFERMYRADASRNSSAGGSGLGLSIVKKILEDHGGRVWASSREGEGTTIVFQLRKYVETMAEAAAQNPVPDPEEHGKKGRKRWTSGS